MSTRTPAEPLKTRVSLPPSGSLPNSPVIERTATTNAHRSADNASPAPTDTTDPSDAAEASNTNRVRHPRQGTPTRRSQPGTLRATRTRVSNHTRASEMATADLTGTVPTPEQWAQQQLKHAPQRSRAWARSVATIYGLELPDT